MSHWLQLQRLRDQIRTWALLPDMRNPEPLHTARHDIEYDMVRPGFSTERCSQYQARGCFDGGTRSPL